MQSLRAWMTSLPTALFIIHKNSKVQRSFDEDGPSFVSELPWYRI